MTVENFAKDDNAIAATMTEPAHNAVLCGIARDEDRTIVEWISHHLALGFGHIYIYDNMSVRPIRTLLSDRALLRHVTVVRWPSVAGRNAQTSAYDHFVHTHRTDAQWAAILDLDEFLNLKQDDSIDQFLARFPHATAVAVNWRIFGSGGETSYRARPATERFQSASPIDFGPNILVKTIYRLKHVRSAYQHHGDYDLVPIIVRSDGTPAPNDYHVPQTAESFVVAQINHYFVKSKDEWKLKNLRGYTDQTKRSAEMFGEYDRNEVFDGSILRFSASRRRIARRIRRPRNLYDRIRGLI